MTSCGVPLVSQLVRDFVSGPKVVPLRIDRSLVINSAQNKTHIMRVPGTKKYQISPLEYKFHFGLYKSYFNEVSLIYLK